MTKVYGLNLIIRSYPSSHPPQNVPPSSKSKRPPFIPAASAVLPHQMMSRITNRMGLLIFVAQRWQNSDFSKYWAVLVTVRPEVGPQALGDKRSSIAVTLPSYIESSESEYASMTLYKSWKGAQQRQPGTQCWWIL